MSLSKNKKNSSRQLEQRYKEIQSQQDTRNPTTNKKIHATPIKFTRTNPRARQFFDFGLLNQKQANKDSLQQRLEYLQYKRLKSINTKRYSKLASIEKLIKRTKSLIVTKQIERLVSQQKKQRRSISLAHKQQIYNFNRVWDDYFQQFHQRQYMILTSFKKHQYQQLQKSRQKIKKRWKSLKTTRSSGQIIELMNKQQLLLKTQGFSLLPYVHQDLKRARKNHRTQKWQQLGRWQEVQEERLLVIQSKKYIALINRLQDYKADKERIFIREQKRLRQKYKNVLVQLQHQQNLQLIKMKQMLEII